MLSIIIPTFNCRAHLRSIVDQLIQCSLSTEIIVSDGGSTDGTQDGVQGIRVIIGEASRGGQMAAGANLAKGSWFLFLHADSSLQSGWERVVSSFIENPRNNSRAGYFSLIFDDNSQNARYIEKVVHWRSRALGLVYGDQGLLINRAHYDFIGGFKNIPLMEDVDIVRRIRRVDLVPLGSSIITSAARYKKEGWWLRSGINLICLLLYFLNVPPKILFKIYYWDI